MRKLALTFMAGILVAAYKAYALMLMWNWFVSPVFHIGSISFWRTLGLLWMVQLFVGEISDSSAETWAWESAFLILDYCVPEEKKEDLKRAMKEKEDSVWLNVALVILGQAAGVTLTLALGWLVHFYFVPTTFGSARL